MDKLLYKYFILLYYYFYIYIMLNILKFIVIYIR